MELSLTGMPVPVTRRPGSASPAKHVVRSVSVVGDGKTKRNALVGDAVLGKRRVGMGGFGGCIRERPGRWEMGLGREERGGVVRGQGRSPAVGEE